MAAKANGPEEGNGFGDGDGPVSTGAFITPAPVSTLNGSVPAVPGVFDLAVEPDKVLAVAKVIEDQADALHERLRNELGNLRLESPSEDIVSTHAIEGWNQVVAEGDGSYAERVRNYVSDLRNLAGQLRKAGQKYATDEDDRSSTFGDRRVFEV